MTDDEYNEEMKRLIVRRERFMFSLLKGIIIASVVMCVFCLVMCVLSSFDILY